MDFPFDRDDKVTKLRFPATQTNGKGNVIRSSTVIGRSLVRQVRARVPPGKRNKACIATGVSAASMVVLLGVDEGSEPGEVGFVVLFCAGIVAGVGAITFRIFRTKTVYRSSDPAP